MAITKRGKYWHVRFYMQPYGEIKRSTKTGNKAEALKFERDLKQQLRNEIQSGRQPSNKTWNDAVIRWVESGAQDSWQPKIDQLTPYFEGALLTDAPKIAADMKHELTKQGLKPTTINRRLAAVRRVLNLAYKEWHWLDQPLADRIKLMSENGTARQHYLTKEQVKAIFDGMTPQRQAFNGNVQVVKIGLLLLVNTGMRKSEMLRLQPDDWQAPNLIIRRAKSGKPRSVPVPAMVHWICDSHLPIDTTQHKLRGWWDKGRESAGLPHIWMHDLRHTFASWYADNPEATMQHLRDILGHSNLSVTSRYTHLLQGNTLPPALGLNLDIIGD